MKNEEYDRRKFLKSSIFGIDSFLTVSSFPCFSNNASSRTVEEIEGFVFLDANLLSREAKELFYKK